MAFKKNVSEAKPVSENVVTESKTIETNLPVITQNILLTSKFAGKLNISKVEAARTLAIVYSTLRETLLSEGEVTIPGLGKLQVKEVGEKSYPSTLANKNVTYVVGPHHKVSWKTTSSLTLGEFYLKDMTGSEEVNF